VTDPVWIAAVLDLVAGNGMSDSAARGAIGPAQARGTRTVSSEPVASP
jgi:hypothetical protein